MSLFTNKANIDEIFQSIDKNKDGKVNLDELLEVIRTLKIPHSLDGVTSFLKSHKYLYSSSSGIYSSSSPPSSPPLRSSPSQEEQLYPIEVVHEFIHLQERRFREAFHELSQQYPLRTTDIERFSSRIQVYLSREEVLQVRSHLTSLHTYRSNQSFSTYNGSNPVASSSLPNTSFLTIDDLRDLFAHQPHAEGTFQTWLRSTVGPSSLALPDEPTNETPTSILLLSGAVAGILSRSFTAPFDRIKTILQASSVPTNSITATGTFSLPSPSLPSLPTNTVTTTMNNFSMVKYFPNKFSMNFSTAMPLLDVPNSRMYSATSSSIIGTMPSSSSLAYYSPSSSVAPPSSATTASARNSVRQIVRSIYTEGGLLSFWRGNGMNVLKVAPETAARMFVYERMKSIVAEDPDEPTLFERFTAGATAGVVAQTVIYPAELIKTRLALSSPGQYKSILHCARTIVQHEGPKALYRGMFASVIGIIPYAGTDLTVYTFLKESWEERNPNKEPSVFTLLRCGAMATISGQIISYPLQLIRTRLQAQGMTIRNGTSATSTVHHGPQYTGIWNCLSQTVKNEGVRGLYRGISVNLMKSVPAMAISYTTFEITKRGLLDWIR